jgi:hypothetical protein
MQKKPFLAARQTKAVKPWPDHTPKWQIAECSLSVLLLLRLEFVSEPFRRSGLKAQTLIKVSELFENADALKWIRT